MKIRHAISLLISLALMAALVACSSSSGSTPPQTISIAATSGSGQSATVGTAFATPLSATVTTGGTPTGGVSVTFTAPASGPGGSFKNGTATETDTTNANGVATATTFTANTSAGAYAVTASVSGAANPTSFSLTNATAPVETIVATSGSPQRATVGTAFVAPLVATVSTGGTPNSGVTVTFTAPATGASGTFATTPPSTTATVTTDANGVATSPAFTANSAVGAYTVTAATPGVAAPANFSLTNSLAVTLADATYVFSLAGEDQFASNGATCGAVGNVQCGPYFLAGAFVVSGGVITSGEQDFIDAGIFASDAITGGNVTVAGSGNLQITLNTADTNIGVGGVETLNGALVTASTGLISEFDASATSSGFLAQQTGSVAAPSQGYAFVTTGLNGSSAPVGFGGVINIDGAGTISGTGSVFDINNAGAFLQGQSFAASTVSAPDSLGRVQFSLVPSATSGIAAINLVGYIVGPKHIWLVETGDPFQGSMGGEALGQGANTGTFSSASFSGSNYVFGASGADVNGAFQAAGVLTANQFGSIGGTINYNDLTGTGIQAPSSVTGGTYTVDPTGRVTLTGVTDGTVTLTLQLYLSGFGDGTVASMDAGDMLTGHANQQSGGGSFSAASFSGLYATNATGFDSNSELEFDATGLVTADGVSAVNGTVDLNFMTPPASQAPGTVLSGSFLAAPSGVFIGNLTGLDIDNPSNSDAFSFYMIDTTRAVAIQTDPNQLTLMKFGLQQ